MLNSTKHNFSTHKINFKISLKSKFTCFVLVLSMVVIYGILTVSCSGADPVIYKINTRLQAYWKYPQEINERLLLQLVANDDDGFDEIYELYIINDASEQYWRATQDEWDVVNQENEDWIVVSNVFAEGDTNLPRGKYRVVILDFSGYRDEKTFTLDQKKFTYSRADFSTLTFQGSNTYIPVSSRGTNNSSKNIIMELAYPNIKNDNAGNPNTAEFNRTISYLGANGSFYTLEPGAPLKFVLNENSHAYVYLHSEGQDDILYTSGPYEITFKKSQ